MYRTWHPGQPHEIVSSSHSATSVSRHGDSVSAFHCSAYSSTGRQSASSDRGVPVHPVSPSAPLASASGPPVVPHAPRPRRDAPDEIAPDLPKEPVEFSGRPVSGLLVPSLLGGSSVVGSGGATAGGSESLSSDSRRQLFIRRLGRRLGSPSRRTPCLGPLVSSSDRPLHQHEIAVGSSVRSPGLRTSPSGPVGGSVLRQCHHSCLSPSFRRDVLLHSERQGEGNYLLGRVQPCPSPASVHHGLIQCHSGHSQPPQSGDRVRVDSPSGGSRSPCPQMAGGDRHFCNVPDRQTSGLLLPGLRLEGGGDGRSSSALGQSPVLRLSSDRHHKESSCQTEVLEELLTLIAPFWPQRDWFLDLLELLSDIPVALPGRKDLLRQPHFHRFHQNLPMLQLTAWRLSNDLPVRPASLLRWLDNLPSVEESPHA